MNDFDKYQILWREGKKWEAANVYLKWAASHEISYSDFVYLCCCDLEYPENEMLAARAKKILHDV